MNKKEIGKYLGLVIISPLLLGFVLAVLIFILLLAPIAVVGYLGYEALNTINDVHRRNKKYKLILKKYDSK